MNFTAIMRNTQKISTRIFATIYVALLQLPDLLRRAWKNRRDLAPVLGRYAIAFMLGALSMVIIFRDRDAKANRETVPAPTAAAVDIMEAPEVHELTPEELAAEQARQMEAMQQAAIQREAQAMARVLYGTALHNSREAQKAVCWCIINRTESTLFPNSIEEVCSQPVQWMGYSDDNPVTQELYDVALEVVQTWHDGGIRMFSKEYLFLTWAEHEIILRTTFNESGNTRYYHVDG